MFKALRKISHSSRSVAASQPLKIFNSLGRTKQDFVPLRAGEARMYVCGMTVYDYCHLGHARVLVVFDVVRRWLRASGYRVTYVRNITDIDDKIIRRAAENGEPIGELTGRFIRAMDEDAAALGVEKPDHEPRATQFVPQMVEMIARLAQKKLAYQSGSGDVNYAVRRFPGYGKLSGKSLDELRAGERVEVDATKEDPLDFVLWKRSRPDEPKWPSRWGEGRPGWHIECSAMSSALLGEQFDIHGGGQDLQFPHHENEIAQSEGANGVKFVNYWMHNGFVQVDKEKMSKSLGNFFTVRDVLARFDPEVVRFFILRAHYRSPLNYSDVHLEDAKAALTRLYTALRGTSGAAAPDWQSEPGRRFKAAMDDDFGTSDAIAVLHELANDAFQGRAGAATQLRALGGVLGLLQTDPEAFLQGRVSLPPAEIERLIAERDAAKRRKDYKAADDIRKDLLDKGIVLEDSPAGTKWRRR
ncbi:MAG TPA: cysteine--tRNA ligase [Burkholderiales bacterium]|nr:cysteine--tRNA ligase [Burkholderiales bacterium]